MFIHRMYKDTTAGCHCGCLEITELEVLWALTYIMKLQIYILQKRSRRMHVKASKSSVCNRSGIIAQHGLSNAKPSIVDLILRLPETNF